MNDSTATMTSTESAEVRAARTCPYCLAEADGEMVSCPRCDAAHHADCYAEAGECAILGCASDVEGGLPEADGRDRSAPVSTAAGENHRSPGPQRMHTEASIAGPDPTWTAPTDHGSVPPPMTSAAVPSAAGQRPEGSGRRLIVTALVSAAVTAGLAVAVAVPTIDEARDVAASESYADGYDDGEAAGLDRGTEAGYESGYLDGQRQGYDEGYLDGGQLAYDDGYEQGVAEGRSLGYDEGYEDGADLTAAAESDAYTRGYDDGYSAGSDDGYYAESDAYNRGYDDGYYDGYDAGFDDSSY